MERGCRRSASREGLFEKRKQIQDPKDTNEGVIGKESQAEGKANAKA